MKLFLLRHGQTEGNLRRLYYGATDLPLLPEAVESLRRDRARYPTAPHYYTSGLLRTEQTLAALYGDVPHTALRGLRETDFGNFEMHGYEELKQRTDYQAWLSDPEKRRCPSGESADDVRARSLAALAPLLARGEDCLCITHGGVIAVLMMHWFGGSRYDYSVPAGGGYEITFRAASPVAYRPLFPTHDEAKTV